MATIYRALACTVLVLYAYVVTTGMHAGDDGAALGLHLRTGLFASVTACLVNSIPFAYFLGTRFWVKAFARASNAGDVWNERHDGWMQGGAYPLMYLVAFFPAGAAIAGGLEDSGRIAAGWHFTLVLASIVTQLATVVTTPRAMQRNSALMDRLADEHSVPKPDTPEMQAYVEREAVDSLPPLFQLSRVLMWVGVNLVVIWLYLRFGTEGWRASPLLPFALGCTVLVAIGAGLNARFDPHHPAPPARSWVRALLTGMVGVALSLWMRGLGL